MSICINCGKLVADNEWKELRLTFVSIAGNHVGWKEGDPNYPLWNNIPTPPLDADITYWQEVDDVCPHCYAQQCDAQPDCIKGNIENL